MTTLTTCEPAGCTVWEGKPEDAETLACCTPVVDFLSEIRTFPADYNTIPKTIYSRWHSVKGDSGGGQFVVVQGMAPGTYTDDDGVTVVFTGGDGSAAAVREIVGNELHSSWWGMPQGGGDASDAIDAMIEFCRERSYCLEDGCATPSFGVVVQPYNCMIDGPVHGISRSIKVYPGMMITWANGAYSRALTQGMRMVESRDGADNAEDYRTYGAKAITLNHPQLDGNHLATHGMLLETVAVGTTINNIQIHNVDGVRFTGVTATSTGDTKTIEVSSSADMQILDVINIKGSAYTYNIARIDDATHITVNKSVGAVTDGAVTQRAVAFHGAMLQQTDVFGGSVRDNDIGMYFGANRRTETDTAYGCTDDRFFGVTLEKNKQACYISNASGFVFSGTTFQFSTHYSDLEIESGRAMGFYNCWVESCATDVIEANNLRYVPNIYIHSSSDGIHFDDLRWVHNRGAAGWRRMMHNAGKTVVRNIACQKDTLPEHPDRPGDYSWIENTRDNFIVQDGDSGQQSITDPGKFITDEDGNPSDNCTVMRQQWGASTHYGLKRYWPTVSHHPVIDIVVGDNEFPSLDIRSTGIWIGDGSHEPINVVRRPTPGWFRPLGDRRTDAWTSTDPAITLGELRKIVKAIQEDLWLYGIFAETYEGNAPEE